MLYPARIEGEIKSFPNKSLKEFIHYTSLTKNVKGNLLSRKFLKIMKEEFYWQKQNTVKNR